jgi:hypothetical protein
MLYTDGVRFFAENGGTHGAYWFLDIVGTELKEWARKQPFMSVHLIVKGDEAVIQADDGNGNVFYRRDIAFTDMQEGDWQFFYTDNVLMLPGEY